MAGKALQTEVDWNAGFFDSAAFVQAALADSRALASVFDHTLLKPEATGDQIVKLCEEAAEFRFACVMVNPCWVALAHSVLQGSGIPVGAVVGFPLGAGLTNGKQEETLHVVRQGAREVDMVLNIGLLKSGMNAQAERDIRGVVQIARESGALVKVILETCLLNVEEKLRAAEMAISAGADFLKTSTGFSTGGATPGDVALLRGIAGSRCGVKASGGIRTLADAQAMLEAGANRLGASAGVAILREFEG